MLRRIQFCLSDPPRREITLLKELSCMEGAVRERWQELCELGTKEQNPNKLLALVEEINRLLEEKEQRLNSKKPPGN